FVATSGDRGYPGAMGQSQGPRRRQWGSLDPDLDEGAGVFWSPRLTSVTAFDSSTKTSLPRVDQTPHHCLRPRVPAQAFCPGDPLSRRGALSAPGASAAEPYEETSCTAYRCAVEACAARSVRDAARMRSACASASKTTGELA